MSQYTIVQNNVVVNVIEADEAYILTNHDNDVAILGSFPVGHIYKGDHFISPETIPFNTGNIVATTAHTNQTVTEITQREFMQRFTQAERIAIRASTDGVVIDIQEDLKSASSVDLTLPEISAALNYLVSVNLLDANRPAEILA